MTREALEFDDRASVIIPRRLVASEPAPAMVRVSARTGRGPDGDWRIFQAGLRVDGALVLDGGSKAEHGVELRGIGGARQAGDFGPLKVWGCTQWSVAATDCIGLRLAGLSLWHRGVLLRGCNGASLRGVYGYGCDGPLVRVEPGERVSGAGVKLYDVISEGAKGGALSVHGASVDVYGLWSETVKGAGDLVVEATAGARVHIWGGRVASTPGSVAFMGRAGSRIVLHSVDERYPTEDDCDAASSVERVP